jgi:hypothetical protein
MRWALIWPAPQIFPRARSPPAGAGYGPITRILAAPVKPTNRLACLWTETCATDLHSPSDPSPSGSHTRHRLINRLVDRSTSLPHTPSCRKQKVGIRSDREAKERGPNAVDTQNVRNKSADIFSTRANWSFCSCLCQMFRVAEPRSSRWVFHVEKKLQCKYTSASFLPQYKYASASTPLFHTTIYKYNVKNK